MFEKLLSLLPYNPSLAHQLAFYGKRMRAEASIRRIGLIFVVLAFLVQFFAVINPPQATVADSTSDLINGGFSTKSEAVASCVSNTKKYATILFNYGISCDDVAAATTQTIRSTDYDKQLYTMGWNPDGSYNYRTNKPTNETPAMIHTIDRPLYWHLVLNQDYGAYTTYKVLRLVSSVSHRTFFILYHCGNLVSIGVPPSMQTCQYNADLLVNDKRCHPAPCALNASIYANDSRCKACPYNAGLINTDSRCHPPVCALNPSIYASDAACKACPYNAGLLKTDSRCHPPLCALNPSIYASDAACKACPFNSSIAKSDSHCVVCPNPRYPNVSATSPDCKKVCQYNSSLDANDSACKPCTASTDSADALACVLVSKTAADITQNWPDANGQTASPGDTIVYTLYAKNSGNATVKAFVMQENLSDVLDYADVVDLNGGTIDNTTGEVTWPSSDIKAGATLSHKITVKVKDPVPQTPASVSDGSHFDLVMTNVYGNTININVPGSPAKTVEVAATTLVNTGPGTSLFVAAAIVIIAGYFYARARLLAKESNIALHSST